jgi:hypothetical protein
VEAEELQELQLASSYESMAVTAAFRDLVSWLQESAESLELKCATADAEDKQHFEAYFSAWQQRKMVVAGIKQRVENQIKRKNVLEEEIHNERQPSGDPAFHPGDTNLRGYA